MALETGDIIIFPYKTFFNPGHAAMCFDVKGEKAFIHGKNSPGYGGFFYADDSETFGAHDSFLPLYNDEYWHFRRKPPADNPGLLKKEISNNDMQTKLKEVASRINKEAIYGVYRACRIYVGEEEFGLKARSKLRIYRNRYEENENKDKNYIIKKITCVQAVVLCYQLIFPEGSRHFINKDSAHLMPEDFAYYLSQDEDGWLQLAKTKYHEEGRNPK